MNIYHSHKTIKGFTLIEILLYISISSVLLLSVSSFFSMLLQSRVKNQTVAEVEQQGLEVMQIITQALRNADVINAPAPGTSAASLSANTLISGSNPTIFDLSSGAIRITEGANPAIPLTNSHISGTNIIFKNLSRSGTPGTVRIQFTLSHNNPGGRNEQSFTKTFIASATLRQP